MGVTHGGQLLCQAAPLSLALPPNFPPLVGGPVVSASSASAPADAAVEDVGGAVGWQEVRNRRHPQLNRPSPSAHPVGAADRAKEFRRRARGQCFRCLESDHLVAACQGRIRCIGCRRSGHRERDCWQRKKAGQAPAHACSRPPAADPLAAGPRRHGRSWASVVAQPRGSAADGGAPEADPDGPSADLRTLQPLLAAQAEALTAELQAMFAARLEVLFKPLQDLVAAAVASPEVPPDEVLKCAFAEEATMLRYALPAMVSSQLDELIKPVRVMSESLQGLLERLGSMTERAVAAMEELSLTATCVQASSAQLALAVSGPPPQVDTIDGFEDWPFDLHDVPLVEVSPKQLEFVVEPAVTVDLDELVAVPRLEGIPVRDLVHGDVPVQDPLDREAPSPMEELLKELEAPPSHFERRSCRLDLKHKGSDIPVSKRAEFRRAEAFGEVPIVKSKGKTS